MKNLKPMRAGPGSTKVLWAGCHQHAVASLNLEWRGEWTNDTRRWGTLKMCKILTRDRIRGQGSEVIAKPSSRIDFVIFRGKCELARRW